MKTLKLRRVQMRQDALNPDNTKMMTLDYKEEAIRLLLTPLDPNAGTNYEEMTQIMPVHAKLSAVEYPDVGDATVQLEDAEHKILVERLKNAKFRINSPEVFEMIRTLSHPKKVTPPAVDPDTDDDEQTPDAEAV